MIVECNASHAMGCQTFLVGVISARMRFSGSGEAADDIIIKIGIVPPPCLTRRSPAAVSDLPTIGACLPCLGPDTNHATVMSLF